MPFQDLFGNFLRFRDCFPNLFGRLGKRNPNILRHRVELVAERLVFLFGLRVPPAPNRYQPRGVGKWNVPFGRAAVATPATSGSSTLPPSPQQRPQTACETIPRPAPLAGRHSEELTCEP